MRPNRGSTWTEPTGNGARHNGHASPPASAPLGSSEAPVALDENVEISLMPVVNAVAVRTRRPSRRDRPVSVGAAVLRYPLLFLVIVVVVAGGAVAVAAQRAPVTTAESRLLIGKLDVEARAIPGFTAATQELASIYARVVPTDAILRPAAKAAGVPVAVASREVSASPIPDSSIVRIEVKDATEARAVRLADAAAKTLSAYVENLNSVDPYSTPSYQRYADAATALAQAQVAQRSAQDQLDELNTPGSLAAFLAGDGLVAQVANAQSVLVGATSQALQAKLRADQLATAFENMTRGIGDTTPAKVIAPAVSKGTDRSKTLELGVLLGIVAGVLLGLAVVVLRANAGYLRALRGNTRDEN